MNYKTAKRLINKILRYGAVEAGIFISLLSYYYQETFEVTEQQFIKSLKNSFKDIRDESKGE